MLLVMSAAVAPPHRPNIVQVLFVGDLKRRWVNDKAINIEAGARFTVCRHSTVFTVGRGKLRSLEGAM